MEVLGAQLAPGDRAHVRLKVAENVRHEAMELPVVVARGAKDGPRLFVTAAIHGDEVNGVAILRKVLAGLDASLTAGLLVAVPVCNRPGFDAGERYLPDRRDLNRHFPGTADGSLAARIAHTLFRAIAAKSDFGVDLHTAARGNSNLCQVRGDAGHAGVKRLMRAFGSPILVDGKGPRGALRREATAAGIPTIAFEAGEPGRFQHSAVAAGHAGLLRLMGEIGMAQPAPPLASPRVLVRRTVWVRSDHGGIADLAVQPGDLVRKGQRVGAIHDPLGHQIDFVESPCDGVVLGVATTPLAYPGVALVHVGALKRTFSRLQEFVAAGGDLGRIA